MPLLEFNLQMQVNQVAKPKKVLLLPEHNLPPLKIQIRRVVNNMPDSSDMSDDELDVWSDINNPNNDADMDDWADAHNPNNDDYIDE